MHKKFFFSLVLLLTLSYGAYYFYNHFYEEKTDENANVQSSEIKKENYTPKKVSFENNSNLVEKVEPKFVTLKSNLYAEYNNISFALIKELSSLQQFERETIGDILDSTEVYYLNHADGSSFLITGNLTDEKYMRNNINFVNVNEIGEKEEFSFSKYTDDEDKLNNWKFDKETKRPLKHIKYLLKKKVDYIEVWNYDDNEPIKYELRNVEDKVLSVKKEILENNVLRIENIKYDNDENIESSISLNYDGPNLVRFIYYDAIMPEMGRIIISEFEEGVRIKEKVYSSNYELLETYLPIYENGERVRIDVYNSKNEKIEEILPE